MSTPRSLQRPALGVPSLSTTGDGVAYVSRLVHRALVEELGEIAVLQIRRAGQDGPISTAQALRYAERIVRTQMVSRPDWWLFTHLGPARVTRKLPRPVRRPYAVFVHGIETWAPELGPGRREVLKDAKLRIANSTYTARRAENTHRDIGRIEACPLGLLPDEPRVADRKGATTPRASNDISALIMNTPTRSVLIVGRMDEKERYKGHDVLLDAWPAIIAQVSDAVLIVVGQGTDQQRLQEKARQLGVANSVIFTGFMQETSLRILRRNVALFAMPATGEGFGLVYLEAMRDRLPCIASNIDAAGDIIVNGETGYLVDPNDAGEVCSAIVPLLQDANLRIAMGEAGRRRFEAQFTYDRFRKRFLDIVTEYFSSN